MSVNGLDSPTVVDAYQRTLADPGGWLLLHYKSRDELDVLNRGTAGWQELRTFLGKYEDKSPLYGFFLYRRRKLVLKYIPEETSRLLQVRTTVHFPAILDHFSPHDATFSASTPNDLTEPALAATCSLHTEVSSASADGSPRRRKNLDEISEDTEEPQSSNPEVTSILARLKANKEALLREQTESPSKNAIAEEDDDHEEPSYPLRQTPPGAASGGSLMSAFDKSLHPRIQVTDPRTNRSPLETGFLDDFRSDRMSPTLSKRELREARSKKRPEVVHNARAESPHLYPRAPHKTNHTLRADLFDTRRNASNVRADIYDPRRNAENMRTALHEPRPSFYESRPGTSDSKYSFLSWKPKAKLFPRPAGEEALKRPATENSTRQKLPSGMRIALHRGESPQKSSKAEKSLQTTASPNGPESTEIPRSMISPSPVEAMYRTPEDNVMIAKSELVPKRKPVPEAEKLPTATGITPPLEESRILAIPTAVLVPKSSESSMVKAGVAPEKQRLMKALQQRNKQLNKDSVEPKPNIRTEIKVPDEAAQKVSEDDAVKADSGVELEGSGISAGGVNPIVVDSLGRELQSIKTTANDEQATLAGKGVDGMKPSQSTIATTASQSRSATNHAKKRKPLVRPIKTSPYLGDESDGLADDDSLMDELQHATVEQARRISIPGLGSESNPASPTYSGGEGKPIIASAKPIVYRNGSISSVQGANLEPIMAAQPLSQSSSIPGDKSLPVKRSNLSSGFSRRIKALAEISNREQSYQSGYGQVSASTHMQATPQSSSVSQHSHHTTTSSRTITNSSTIQHTSHSNMNSQSVSITARIVQPSGSNNQARIPLRGGPGMDLQQSEVTVQRDTDVHTRSPSKTSFFRVDRPPSLASRPESRESSLSSPTKRSAEHGFNFLGLRKSSEAKPPSRSRRSPSIATLETVDEDADEKAKPKKPNIFKRMSGLAAAASRKSHTGSGERDNKPGQRPGTGGPKAGFIVGDLNVQFPDTLLWKRRWVEVEHSGFLTLNSTNPNERMRVPPRRYHMSELKAPTVASQDGQELPFSILVDLVSGGTLQFACEDPISQAQVLRRLSDTHHAWTLYGS